MQQTRVPSWVGKTPWRKRNQQLQYSCPEFPWTEETGGPQPMRSEKNQHDLLAKQQQEWCFVLATHRRYNISAEQSNHSCINGKYVHTAVFKYWFSHWGYENYSLVKFMFCVKHTVKYLLTFNFCLAGKWLPFLISMPVLEVADNTIAHPDLNHTSHCLDFWQMELGCVCVHVVSVCERDRQTKSKTKREEVF